MDIRSDQGGIPHNQHDTPSFVVIPGTTGSVKVCFVMAIVRPNQIVTGIQVSISIADYHPRGPAVHLTILPRPWEIFIIPQELAERVCHFRTHVIMLSCLQVSSESGLTWVIRGKHDGEHRSCQSPYPIVHRPQLLANRGKAHQLRLVTEFLQVRAPD